ncbi:MAG TPA: hypothetical protein VH591_17855 [Ktedonobacterales bacterium]|jgi:hypothetical protein
MFQEVNEIAADARSILKLLALLASGRDRNVTGADFFFDCGPTAAL